MAVGTSGGLLDSPKATSVFKHAILRQYVTPFIAKVGSSAPGGRVMLVDGFAGRGRFDDGNPGSTELFMRAAAGLPGVKTSIRLFERKKSDADRLFERAATANTPKAIEKAIDDSVSRVPTYLRALAAAHAATAQGAAFLCADLAFRGDTAVEAHVRALRNEAAQSHTIINEVTGRLAAADSRIQSLFDSLAAHLRKRRQVPIPFTDKKIPVSPVPVLLRLSAIDGADRLISAKKNTDAQRRLSDRLWYHGEASATGRAYLDRLDALVGVIDAQAQQPRAITEA